MTALLKGSIEESRVSGLGVCKQRFHVSADAAFILCPVDKIVINIFLSDFVEH